MGRRLGSFKEPPYIGFAECLNVVIGIYEKMGGTASRDDLAEFLGNTPSSSSFVKKVSILRAYGLLTGEGNAFILSDLARSIVAPSSKAEEAKAKVEAFRKIEVFARVHDMYKGKICPEEVYLANTIEREAGVPADSKSAWAKAFLEAVQAAGLYLTQGGKGVIRSDAPVIESVPVETSSQQEREMDVTGNRATEAIAREENIETGAGTVRLVFPFPGKGEAKIFLPGNLTQKEVEKLLALLRISLSEATE